MTVIDFIKKYKLMPWIYIIVLALIVGGIYLWLKYTGILVYFSSYEALESYLNSKGSGGALIFFILQVLQVIIAPIPGNVSTLVGSAVFGFWKGFALSTLGVFCGSLIAFGIGKLFGRNIVTLFVKEETINKYLGTFANKQSFMLFVFFFLPGFPDDLLCFIAGLTKISWRYFITVSILGRPWGLLGSAFIGAKGLNFPIWVYIVGAIVTIIIVIVAFKYGPIFNQRVIDWGHRRSERLKQREKKS